MKKNLSSASILIFMSISFSSCFTTMLVGGGGKATKDKVKEIEGIYMTPENELIMPFKGRVGTGIWVKKYYLYIQTDSLLSNDHESLDDWWTNSKLPSLYNNNFEYVWTNDSTYPHSRVVELNRASILKELPGIDLNRAIRIENVNQRPVEGLAYSPSERVLLNWYPGDMDTPRGARFEQYTFVVQNDYRHGYWRWVFFPVSAALDIATLPLQAVGLVVFILIISKN